MPFSDNNWLDAFNPFSIIGSAVGNVVADTWTGIMLSLWGAGLWVLKWVLIAMDELLTPDIAGSGPVANLYQTTFWAAGALVLIMTLVQIGFAAARRDGKSLARVLIGGAQFIVVWAAWISYGVLVIAACGGLTKALMKTMLGIDAWSHWQPMGEFDMAKAGVEVTLATVLGFLGLFMWLAAIGHFIVMLARGAALLILAAVTPIAAAGLVSDAGRSWFWKSLRWFHAAALTPVVCVLVLGIGVQLTSGVAQGQADTAQGAIGTALPGTMLILISVIAPVALFKLLAFVDPGTNSGASMRAGMATAGGIQGLLGKGKPGETTSAASASSGSSGQAQGEAQSNEATANRFGSAFSKLGGIGEAIGAGVGKVSHFGAVGAAVGIDTLNQVGVGDSSYFPDYQNRAQSYNPDQRNPESNNGSPSGLTSGQPQNDDSSGPPMAPQLPTPPQGTPPSSTPPGFTSPSSGPAAASGGGATAGGSASFGAAGAGAVPPVV